MRCGAVPLDDGAKTAVLDYANAQPIARGDYIGYMFGPMAEHAEKAGLAIIDINEGSDCYHFVVAPAGVGEKWAGANLSALLRAEYPGWQFKKQLPGSPYSRFYRER